MQPDDAEREQFLHEAQAYRRELLAHCYRMTGSPADAEDLVQETYLRAWRGYATFEGRAALRSWLYRIATNVCLTALQASSRRVLPSGLGGPTDDPDAPPSAAPAGTRWIEPVPDAVLWSSAEPDPAEAAAARAQVRLALIASLQHLPARQRSVLLLREVLAVPAAEVAAMLDMSVPAVKSALQRARARIDELAVAAEDVVEPDSPAARAVLERYITAFESADAKALEDLLRDDARIEVAGSSTWFAGKATCARYLARHVLRVPGEYRMVPTVANGQPAAVTYRRQAGGPYAPFGIAVLGTDGTQLTSITVFGGAELVARFGSPLD